MIHPTIQYYSVLKINELQPMKSMKEMSMHLIREKANLKELNTTKRYNCNYSRKGKTMKTIKRLVVARGEERHE